MAPASASSASRLCVLACRQAARLHPVPPRLQHLTRTAPISRRAFTTTIARRAEQPPKKDEPAAKEEQPASDTAPSSESAAKPSGPAVTTPFATAPLEVGGVELQGSRIMDATAKEHGYGSFDEFVSRHLEKGPNLPANKREFDRDFMGIVEPPLDKKNWFYQKEDPDNDTEEAEDFDEDDMTVMGHAKLQEVQEMRHYQRLAVWELPLLSKLAKPFEPPTEKQVLRWRYTTYFGDTHPAEKKVVVQFAPDDLRLTKVQTDKLKKLCGTRYNPETEMVKMSCESYEHQAQNKRYLAEQIDTIIAEAKDSKDTFEDIPLDTRHHKVATKPRFPKEWLMTEERRRFLEKNRAQQHVIEATREEAGQVVDGKAAIDGYLLERVKEDQEKELKLAEMVAAPAKSNARAGPKAKARR